LEKQLTEAMKQLRMNNEVDDLIQLDDKTIDAQSLSDNI